MVDRKSLKSLLFITEEILYEDIKAKNVAKCSTYIPNLLFWSQDSRDSNQFFDDVNLAPITQQIPEGEQDMSERQNSTFIRRSVLSNNQSKHLKGLKSPSVPPFWLIIHSPEGTMTLFGPNNVQCAQGETGLKAADIRVYLNKCVTICVCKLIFADTVCSCVLNKIC